MKQIAVYLAAMTTGKEKEILCTMSGVIGAIASGWFGGWDESIKTLIIFMAVDYITGLVVGGVFKKSTKTETGALESKAGWKGLCRKCGTLILVLVACRVDVATKTTYVRDAVVIGFVVNEAISITENIGLMGVPLPAALTKAIDVLQAKAEKGAE